MMVMPVHAPVEVELDPTLRYGETRPYLAIEAKPDLTFRLYTRV